MSHAPSSSTCPNKSLCIMACLVGGVLLALLLIVLLIRMLGGGIHIDPGSPLMTADAIKTRVQPVAMLKVQEGPVAAPGSRTGEAIYHASCVSCHGTGLVGAPKFEDQAAWGPRIAGGYTLLRDHAVHGYKGMPARGGASDLTDDEVARAVAYMANAAGAKFIPPPVKGAE